jgi:hypothetical protein
MAPMEAGPNVGSRYRWRIDSWLSRVFGLSAPSVSRQVAAHTAKGSWLLRGSIQSPRSGPVSTLRLNRTASVLRSKVRLR